MAPLIGCPPDCDRAPECGHALPETLPGNHALASANALIGFSRQLSAAIQQLEELRSTIGPDPKPRGVLLDIIAKHVRVIETIRIELAQYVIEQERQTTALELPSGYEPLQQRYLRQTLREALGGAEV